MDALAFLEKLKAGRHYRNQIQAVRVLDERAASYRDPAQPLPEPVRRLLQTEEITQLYEHQADAIDAAREGRDVVICTGTASGKSLCYLVPVLSALVQDPQARAACMFPTKALAYDQLASLQHMVELGGLADIARPACYDGDTPSHKRPGIRRTANILLSNPDMLHVSVLPYHTKWAAFFANLRYVVIDEIHTYRGIFGSHVAGVLRRLQRICAHYGSRPTFICCSATVGNPKDLAQHLIGRDVELVDRDTSPRGRKYVVLWNPPWLEDRDREAHEKTRPTFKPPTAEQPLPSLSPTGPTPSHPTLAPPVVDQRVQVARRSGNVEATELMHKLMVEDAGTITFCKARVVAELLYTYVTDGLKRRRPDLAKRIKPYRGGYLPGERRQIEEQLFTGELLGVCCTNALELGIDVGSLDAALIVGFPGTLCSLWQQAGRAGRRQEESLAIFVAYDDPIDQYLMRQSEFLFDQPLEHAIIDPENPYILAAQLGCAAQELPLTADDLADFGVIAADVAEALTDDGKLRHTADKHYWARPEFPAAQTSLRTISNATYAIIDTTADRNEVIGQVDSISAPELVYPEAVYLHQGDSYLVRELDMPMKTARVERLDADYYTQPVLADECKIGEEQLAGELFGGEKHFGAVSVKWQTIAFRKFKLFTQELIGQTVLDLPAQQIDTAGTWLIPPAAAVAAVKEAGHKPHEALSGVRNLLMVSLPPIAMCDRYDIGGVVSSQLGVVAIILYDRYQGGVGYARHGFEAAEELFEMAHAIVAGCPCEDGCPGCVAPPNLRIPIHHDPDLGHGYAIPDKRATLAMLTEWMQRRSDGAT
jgi:DEAD/DEAH box helicase domain-containing protein